MREEGREIIATQKQTHYGYTVCIHNHKSLGLHTIINAQPHTHGVSWEFINQE